MNIKPNSIFYAIFMDIIFIEKNKPNKHIFHKADTKWLQIE